MYFSIGFLLHSGCLSEVLPRKPTSNMCEALSLLFEPVKLTLKFLALDVLQNVEARFA